MRDFFRFFQKTIGLFVLLMMAHSFLQAETNSAAPKTGIFEFEKNANSSLFVCVPEEYNPARSYALIISIPSEEEKVEDHLKSWASVAERSGVIVASPSFALRSSNAVTSYDDWILGFSAKLSHQYRISKTKVFLIGTGERANYAAYLGLSYADRFSAVALLNGAWNGPYEKMMTVQKNPRKQVPFYVALKGAESSFKNQVELKAAELQKKGYMIQLEELKSGEEFSSKEFQKKIYSWLNEKSDVWQDLVQTHKKSWKEKFKMAVEENIAIDH